MSFSGMGNPLKSILDEVEEVMEDTPSHDQRLDLEDYPSLSEGRAKEETDEQSETF